jgi:hypothetical protein
VTRQQHIIGGCTALVLGAWWLHQAYEGAGKPRPFWARFLPG